MPDSKTLLRYLKYALILIHAIDAYVLFTLTIEPSERLYFGENLTAEVKIESIEEEENLNDVVLQFFTSERLHFNMEIHRKTCRTAKGSCTVLNQTKTSAELEQWSDMFFNGMAIGEVFKNFCEILYV